MKKVSLKARRIELGLSQWDVALAVGVTGAMVSQWERKFSSPSAQFLGPLAAVLKVESSDVLDVAAPRKPGRPPIDITATSPDTVSA